MTTQMLGTHQSTYDAVFRHPISRNLHWRDVRSMLTALAELVEDHGETVKFTRNGQSLSIHPPTHKDFSDVADLMRVRHFLQESETPLPVAEADGTHLLVVIDHREARIYRNELHGSVPQRLVPLDPQGSRRHLHNVDDNSNGQRKPELKSFYEAVTQALRGAEKILLMGSATGSSSAMDHLQEELKEHHPEIARRVVGAVHMNEQHMTDDQLLAAARAFYATADA